MRGRYTTSSHTASYTELPMNVTHVFETSIGRWLLLESSSLKCTLTLDWKRHARTVAEQHSDAASCVIGAVTLIIDRLTLLQNS